MEDIQKFQNKIGLMSSQGRDYISEYKIDDILSKFHLNDLAARFRKTSNLGGNGDNENQPPSNKYNIDDLFTKDGYVKGIILIVLIVIIEI